MKPVALALALLGLAAPAHAQLTIYHDHPVVWQTPSGCQWSVRFGEQPWTPHACSRVEVSTAASSHNIRFVTETSSVTYVTSKEAPTVVHAMGFIGSGETVLTPAEGRCSINAAGHISCLARAGDSISITHVASFIHPFPELNAILR